MLFDYDRLNMTTNNLLYPPERDVVYFTILWYLACECFDQDSMLEETMCQFWA